jgi:hypothetical protein
MQKSVEVGNKNGQGDKTASHFLKLKNIHQQYPWRSRAIYPLYMKVIMWSKTFISNGVKNCILNILYIQGVPEEEINILGGHRICYYKQKYV